MSKKFIVKENFSNGEGYHPAGSLYLGECASELLKEGLLECIVEAPVAVEAPKVEKPVKAAKGK